MNRFLSLRAIPKATQRLALHSFVAASFAPAVATIQRPYAAVYAPSRSFSKKGTSSLSDLLASEIAHEEEKHQVDQELVDVTKLIQKSFKIHSEENSAVVELTRTFNDESIKVRFDVQAVNDGLPYDDSVDEDAGAGEEGDEGEEFDNNFGIDFEVTVEKAKGKIVASLSATDQDVVYRGVRFLPADKPNSDMEYYGGPSVEDLDEKLQEGIVAYFEKRGINSDLSYFIVAYSREKEQQEYVRWLKNVHDFTASN